ncbi:MAG TPA: hypothetical protein PKC76_13185 [Saprospiraceae bacterium]|nr:hypothetical protein [Saprospiraceae bacterium]HMP25086.1 hypothetical protein [Saprospiraceae bacterium]
MKQKSILAIVIGTAASIGFTIWTGLLVNIISDVTDNFKVKDRMNRLESGLYAAQQAVPSEAVSQPKDSEAVCIASIKEKLKQGQLSVGVFNHPKFDFNEKLSYELSSVLSIEGLSPSVFADYSIAKDIRQGLAPLHRPNTTYLLVFIEPISVTKCSEISENPVFKDKICYSAKVNIEFELFDMGLNEKMNYCSIQSSGFASSADEARKNAEKEVLSLFSQ